MKSHRIAFIGLGAMGFPMATLLHKAGHTVTAFDLDPETTNKFMHLGGRAAQNLSSLGEDADIMITMLPNGSIVKACLLGDDGALSRARAGTIVVDMSSSDPLGTRSLGHQLKEKSIRLIDAPVSGGVRRATDGTLAIMMGGATADVEEVRPVLQSMGQKLFHVGDLGAGHAAKALNNFVSAAGLVAMCEAFLVAEKFGINLETFTDVLNSSTGKNNSTELKAKAFVIPQTFNSGFALSLMAKDVGIANKMAEALSVEAEELNRSAILWSSAEKKLGKNADHTAIYAYLKQSKFR